MLFSRSFRNLRSPVLAPALVGTGIATLFAAAWWPAAPVVTAMAVIALGATEITLSRYRGTTALLPVVILHGATYAALYGLFVGARLHAAGNSAMAGLNGFEAFDLALSLIPMAIAAQRATRCLRQSIPTKQ
jgi:hypothetical protein